MVTFNYQESQVHESSRNTILKSDLNRRNNINTLKITNSHAFLLWPLKQITQLFLLLIEALLYSLTPFYTKSTFYSSLKFALIYLKNQNQTTNWRNLYNYELTSKMYNSIHTNLLDIFLDYTPNTEKSNFYSFSNPFKTTLNSSMHPTLATPIHNDNK